MTLMFIIIVVSFILAEIKLPHCIYYTISKCNGVHRILLHLFFHWKGIMESNEKQSEGFDTTTTFKKLNWLRVSFAVSYFVLGFIGLILCGIIYLVWQPKVLSCSSETTEYLFGFFFCFCCASIGFAAIAFHWSCQPDPPLPDYITYYPLQLIAIAILVPSLLLLWTRCKMEIPAGVFYPLSGSLCFTMGFYVDSIMNFFNKP